jgi:uroporphyrinogen decarboxylase
MNSRERLLTALDGGEPDRIPAALGFYHVDLDALAPKGAWQDEWLDVQFIRFPISPEENELRRTARKYTPDTRLGNPSQVATYQRWRYRPQGTADRNPLANVSSMEELEAFPFPDLRKPYLVKDLARQVEILHDRGMAAGGNLPHLGGELFEAAWRLRGLQNFLLDLLERPDWAHFLLDRLTDLACRNAQALTESGIDVLSLDDDIGMPETMMISPDMWRTFFKPRFERIVLEAKFINPEVRILYHSDGYFTPIVKDLSEIGVDAINPLQPEYMDAVKIREKYGNQPALWGTLGRQTTFSFSSTDAIREEVQTRIMRLGRCGLVLCPAYDIDEPDIPWENVKAFLEAVQEYG